MVVYVGMDNDCSDANHKKVLSVLGTSPNASCDCGFGDQTLYNVSLPASVNKSTKRKFHINTGRAQPQNIGLHVNTNVHLKAKRLEYRDYVIAILLCLLVGHMLFTYLQCLQLRAELEMARREVDMFGEGLNSVSAFYDNLQDEMKKLEGTLKENWMPKNEIHSLSKRETEPLETFSNCTDSTRHARSVRRGPLAVHLRGALPEITVKDGGIISPWYIDKTTSGMFHLTDGVVGEGKGIIEIVEEGLYFLYAQMYYLTSSSLNSYAINLQLGEVRGREDIVVAVCSAEAAANKLSELSCFTAVVRYLHRGDRIYVTQRERNRRIIFRDNKSFLGLTLLNSPHGFTQ